MKDEYEAWESVYVEDGDSSKDLHQLFADELGISRQSAKRLYYRNMYGTVNLVKQLN